jgi:hypothetical protein
MLLELSSADSSSMLRAGRYSLGIVYWQMGRPTPCGTARCARGEQAATPLMLINLETNKSMELGSLPHQVSEGRAKSIQPVDTKYPAFVRVQQSMTRGEVPSLPTQQQVCS